MAVAEKVCFDKTRFAVIMMFTIIMLAFLYYREQQKLGGRDQVLGGSVDGRHGRWTARVGDDNLRFAEDLAGDLDDPRRAVG